jgi:hypothetical protein
VTPLELALSEKYNRTDYGWEPKDAWRPMAYYKTPQMEMLERERQVETDLFNLVMATVKAGASHKDAVKWWGIVIDLAVAKNKEE